MAWLLWTGARAAGVTAYEAAFTAFSSKEAVVAMGSYTVASEVYSATTGRSMSRDAYLRASESLSRAATTLSSVGEDAKRFESSNESVVKMM